MKLTLKFILVICLFNSMAFAEGQIPIGGKTDGNMGTGGFTEGQYPIGGKTSGDMTSGGFADGDMGNGGRTANNTNQTDSVLTFIQKYLISMFG